MFVKSIKSLGGTLVTTALLSLGFGVPANALDYETKAEGTIPVTITLTGVKAGTTPLYISVQKRGDYRSQNGFGGLLKTTSSGTVTAKVKVDKADDYAVSIWHDLDNDGQFSMTKDYKIIDGWGASGNVPTNRAPNFDDVKVFIPLSGSVVTVDMIYPY